MVLLTRIYTKTGDKGMTSLGNGRRIPKDSLRIEAIGEVDEVNATLGVAIQVCEGPLVKILQHIQNDLFDLGADLCMPETTDTPVSPQPLRITTGQVTVLEKHIDELNANLPPLTSFILPGGSEAACALHLARTVARRAERRLVALDHHESLNREALRYVNRLSDLLFVMARYVHTQSGLKDVLWVPGSNR